MPDEIGSVPHIAIALASPAETWVRQRTLIV
jgi:hypothetical protein